MSDLPLPDSGELRQLLPRRDHQILYRLMYEHREAGLTRPELRHLARPELGDQEQLDRRARELNKKFDVQKVRDGRTVRHRLVGAREEPGKGSEDAIAGALRYRVLEKGRCMVCGRSPASHAVVLVVDHVVPKHWGGPSQEWNLQPLCEQCNREKKERLSAYNERSAEIARAMEHKEPQRRIGELLLAFGGKPVPADLVRVVASGGRYRNDWERRFRDLRALGWDVRVGKIKVGDRYTAEYWVEHAEPWPEGSISAAIRQAGKRPPRGIDA